MSSYKVVKGVKCPPRNNERDKYPFRTMKPGDAFFFKSADRAKVSTAAGQYGTRHGMKFRVAKHNEGHGCWRVS